MSSETPRLEPIIPEYRLRILSGEQLGQLRSGTLEILQDVGVHCPSERALAIYADHGAQVDFESQLVKLPPDVVLGAMAHAPRFYTMGARAPAFDLALDGTAMYCATDGCGTETIDFQTRQRRLPCKDDVAKMARVSDYLTSIGFYWPIVTAHDYPATAPLHELDASFNNTVKHVQSETGSGMGLLHGCTVLYPEELVLDTDIYHQIRINAAGLQTSREELALDVIKEIGPRGHFLSHRHTRKNLRRRQFSDITRQLGPDGGVRDPVKVAREKTEWILENHHPEPLAASQMSELDRILQAAEQELAHNPTQ